MFLGLVSLSSIVFFRVQLLYFCVFILKRFFVAVIFMSLQVEFLKISL